MKRLIWSSLGFVLVSACVSTDVGNPIDTEIAFKAYEGSPEAPQALTLDNGVTLEKAYLKVKGFTLDRSEACDDRNASYNGAIVVDLLTGERSASSSWRDEAGTFCRLRIELSADDVLPQPVELQGASLYIEGTFEGESFEMSFVDTPALSLRGPFTLPVGSHLLQVGFFPRDWFTDVDTSALTGDVTSSDVLQMVMGNFLLSGRLYHDTNQDGVLDLIELSTSLAEGE